MDTEVATPVTTDENAFALELTKTFVTSIVATAGMVVGALVIGAVKCKLDEKRAARKAAKAIKESPILND